MNIRKKSIRLIIRQKMKTTPLHLCAEYENYSVAEILLRKGAVVDPVDKYGNTPLWVAVFNEDYKLAQLLVSYGANKDNKNLNNKSPLDFAKQTGNEDMINILSIGTKH